MKPSAIILNIALTKETSGKYEDTFFIYPLQIIIEKKLTINVNVSIRILVYIYYDVSNIDYQLFSFN